MNSSPVTNRCTSPKRHKLYGIVLLVVCLSSCMTSNRNQIDKEADDIHLRVSLLKPGISRYENMGPFLVTERRNMVISLSPEESREVDIFQTSAKGRVPIAILSHGNYSGKRAHSSQAERLASWGFNVIVLELPNRNQWIENGRRIFELSQFLSKWPKSLGENSDGSRIILIGHSFGGSAVTLAASQGAPVAGVILLDPAVVHPSVSHSMTKVEVPGVLLGADTAVFTARKRTSFRKNWFGEFIELSVKGATHDDAQGPSMFSFFALGIDPFTTSVQREVFMSAIVSASISISTYGNLELFKRDAEFAKASGRVTNLKTNAARY